MPWGSKNGREDGTKLIRLQRGGKWLFIRTQRDVLKKKMLRAGSIHI